MLGHVWSSAGIWPFGFKGSSEHADDNAARGDEDLGADDEVPLPDAVSVSSSASGSGIF